MHKLYILLTIVLASTTITYANFKIDSVGVENINGKKVIIYKVEAKETYYSIAKKYNLNYLDVMDFNNTQVLKIGVLLKIPTQKAFSGVRETPKNNANTDMFAYTIAAKDNLNLLAEKYGTTINEIKRINNLTSSNLQIGQIIQIPNNGANTAEIINQTIVNTTPAKKEVEIVNETEIVHSVKAKENLNLLAQMYGTTVEEIKSANGLTSINLQIGQLLKIPSKNQTILPETAIVNNPVVAVAIEKPKIETKVQQPIEKPAIQQPIGKIETKIKDGTITHTVETKETIYAIAKKYNTTTYQIKTANNLSSNDLTVGQKLIIVNLAPTAVNSAINNENEDSIESITTPNLKVAPSKYGISQVEEKGVAVWIIDQDLDPAKMLILHRTATVGTIIKITNPMTSKSTFAKVVGKFTENESTKDVIIVMTKAVADAIGALDKRFACTLSYGAIENEQ